MKKWTILLLLGVVLLVVVPLAFHSKKAAFGGSDNNATSQVMKIDPSYHRWFKPLWEPPSGEIESLLFAVQAAIGTGAVAYAIGYFMGRAKAQAQAKQPITGLSAGADTPPERQCT